MIEADLAALAQRGGLPLVDPAKVATLADGVTEAFLHYAVWHRAEVAEAGPSEVKEWARGLHRWAADGLVMLGGGLDSDGSADDSSPRTAAIMQLVHGWPVPDEQLRCEYLTRMAAGSLEYPDHLGESPDISDVVHRCVAAVELIQVLTTGVIERAASRRSSGRRPLYERRDLIMSLANAYRDLHGNEPTFARSPGDRGRQGLPTGPAIDWFRGVLDLVASRSRDPVLGELAVWGRRSDAIAEVLREMSRK